MIIIISDAGAAHDRIAGGGKHIGHIQFTLVVKLVEGFSEFPVGAIIPAGDSTAFRLLFSNAVYGLISTFPKPSRSVLVQSGDKRE
jgi:hypothetical protein